jgi:oligosaccharide repeat unit polymerase
MAMLFLYEIRLIRYYELSPKTWFVIISAFVGFVLGIMTIYSARGVFNKNNIIEITPKLSTGLFYKNGLILKLAIIFFFIIGILSALQHWKVILDEYGTFTNIIINAAKIYRERVESDAAGVIPYVWLSSYVGVFIAGLYSAYINKFKLIASLPLIAVLIKEIANFGRVGILLSFFEFFISYLLFRHYLSWQDGLSIKTPQIKMVLSFVLLFALLTVGASTVKFLRNPVDSIKGSSSELQTYRGGFVISPSIYLYASSHVGVLNKHLEEEAQAKLIGSKTISPIYRFLGRFEFVQKPAYHQKGYFTPQWTNTGTYLRDIHGDFSYWGVFTIPFLLGLLCTYFWFKFYEEGKIRDYIILTYLYILVVMSFLVWVSSFPQWMVTLMLLLILIPLLEKAVSFAKAYDINSRVE